MPPLMLRTLVAMSAISLAVGTLAADTITLKSGRTISGTVIERNDTFVKIRRTSAGGLEVVSKHKVADIASVDAPERKGVAYARIPFVGTFGEGITAEAFTKSLDAARADGATVVLLYFDSPGGSVKEMARILDIIQASKDVRFVAVVKRAISAAAITAMACPDIVMLPDSTIGAAVAFQVGPDGTPQNIEEKFASVIRAFMRQAAVMGHHDPLWVRAMTEPEVTLFLTPTENAGGTLSDVSLGETSKLLKPAGRILTLTGTEASENGLARGNALSMGDVRRLLLIPEWHETSDTPWKLGLAAAQATDSKALELGNLKAQYDQALRDYGLQGARDQAAITQYTAVKTRYRESIADLDNWARQQYQAAASSSSPDAAKGRVREEYAHRRGQLDQRFVPELDKAQRTAKDAAEQADRIAKEIDDLKARGVATAKR